MKILERNIDSYSKWKNWDTINFGNYSSNEERYFEWHMKRVFHDHSKHSVLEIGFGNGSFMGWLVNRGHMVVGVEENTTLVESAKEKNFTVYDDITNISSSKKFELIAAFDVIEHIKNEQLVDFLICLREKLAKNGAILLRFPNGDSPMSLPYQNGDITHASVIGIHKLKQIATMAELEIVKIGDAPWYADQIYPKSIRAWLRYLIRRSLEILLGFAYFNQSLDLSPNMVVILRSS